MKSKKFILWFNQLGIQDVPYVGGKNASLGEMYRTINKKGVNVPNGFAITAYAYRYILEKAGVEDKIKEALEGLDTHNIRDLQKRGAKVRAIVRNAELPEELQKEIKKAYKKLCKQYGLNTDVAVRSSATAEDLPDASFAGQQDTYLNIRGDKALLEACKKCFASLFTNRAISYRVDKHFDHFSVALSIGVQKMIRSDKASSGVMFTLDTETGFRDVVYITGSWGLGENIVQGAVNPDEYYVFKPTLKKGKKPILSKKVGSKKIKMIYVERGEARTKNIPVSEADRAKFILDDNEVLTLAKWGVIIEDHYTKKAGKYKPMDIEWAKDGFSDKLFIVQARPETVQSQKDFNVLEDYELKEKGEILTIGKSVGAKIGQGKVNIIEESRNIERFKPGEVLVTDMTDPDWEPIMKIASAIVTNRGGRTCFSGDTRILTDNGFMTMEEVYECDKVGEIRVPSLNRDTLKIEWKPVIASMKRKSKIMKIAVSQTGRARNNILKLTPDHKMINIRGANLVDSEISEMLGKGECVSVAQMIPKPFQATEKDKRLAYLLGAVATDGHIYTTRTKGEVQFIQKPTPEKQAFIKKVTDSISELYNKTVGVTTKKTSSGTIRGKPCVGSATAYRLYSKQIAYDLKDEQQMLVQTMLNADEGVLYNFLAGVLDGDGSYNHNSSRINIYVSKENLLQAVLVSCLRLGISPQVTNNRNIYNVQIVEKVGTILSHTHRLKGKFNRKVQSTRFFNTKQVFGEGNFGTKINTRRDRNLLISEKDISSSALEESLKCKVDKIVNSDLRQLRAVKVSEPEEAEVYNITVADNHNYVVFTEQYSPVLVNNCHAAIVSRELGIPCVVGTGDATEKIKKGQDVTVSCAEGEDGFVYKGKVKYEVNRHNLKNLKRPKTKVMMNVGNPERAFEQRFIPNDGVGLAREEFIINEYIKIHPLALLHYDKLKDKRAKEQIRNLTKGYKDKKQFFIDKLAQGVSMIGAAFYPRPVIVRMSDFKSNEYANLIGGKAFEPVEDNPMIGWRGASRYYDEHYKEAFWLECVALKKVRDEMGLTNIKLMVPFCRTVEEGKSVLEVMKQYGLKRGENGLEVYVMCEIPSNVILADEFSKIFDGFSIGSNDLTQLTLGLDRDSSLVAHIFDERNEAVKKLIARVISVAKKNKRKIGICGDSPSTFPEIARFLVDCGIDSISLSPDAVMKTTLIILKEEKRLRKPRRNPA